ncbi:MAG: peptidylprolyl isomerase, partial [Clostridia bacterium]|nr:peptidylprolyl isomerase [Clostridia bacterium]
THKNDYDTVNYRTFTVKVALPEHLDANGAAYSDDTTKAADAAVLAEALQDLDARLKAVTSEEEFLALAEEMTRTTDAEGNETAGVTAEQTLMANIAYASLSDDIKDWMFDAARTTGDININSGTSTLVAFYFLDRNDRSNLTRDVRHILFKSSEESDTIKGQAVEVLAMYNNGDKTPEAFGELAKTYSEDTGSGENGGLYENVYTGQMITEFNNWLFDEARQAGDVEIIYSASTGYHIMYYVGESDRTERQILADSDIRDARYDAYINDLEMLYPLTTYEAGLAKID